MKTMPVNENMFFWISLPGIAAALLLGTAAYAEPLLELNLELGPMADHGASPWYTEELQITGSDRIKFALDNGADFIWATSSLCTTTACNAHAKLDTSVPGFEWIDKTPTQRTFGPWGAMTTWTGAAAVSTPSGASLPLDFFASVHYEGQSFQDLAWDGGIGLPARSDRTTSPSAFLPKVLKEAGFMGEPVFSQVTNPDANNGKFIFGGVNENYFSNEIVTVLPPKPVAGTDDAWGTELHSFAVGDTVVDALTGAIFFLDTGSSRFKGDEQYVHPILAALMEYKDSSGNPIFKEIFEEDGRLAELAYSSGAPWDYENLPDITIHLGTDCGNDEGEVAAVTLAPEQYSYQVDIGDRAGQWVIAFRMLDHIGGLLVGSTFLDLFYSVYKYNVDDQNNYTQGDMLLYVKGPQFGPGPAGFACE